MTCTGSPTAPASQPTKRDGVNHARVSIESVGGTLYPWSLTRVMKRGNRGHNSRVMRSSGHGRKNTRVMKAEDGDDVDARLVKRGEEENKYVRVMRKAKDTFSRAGMEDLDGEIETQRVEGNMDGNFLERPTLIRFLRRTMKRQDQVAFSRGMLTRVG